MIQSNPLQQILDRFLPAGCSQPVYDWFMNHRVLLRISRRRRSKLGDFRSGGHYRVPEISVNHNLNVYSFLITLLHEMAHAEVYLAGGRRETPHGRRWKEAYRRIAAPFLADGLLPEAVRLAFSAYMKNPGASSTVNVPLAEALAQFDPPRNGTLISALEPNALFGLPDGRRFVKGEKLRKRYRCLCLTNKRTYLFSPLAEIIPLNEQNYTA